MGDHRISIKIEFEMHGFKDKWDTWLNWSDSIPQQAADWIESRKERAMAKFYEEDAEYREQIAREKINQEEIAEREQYERLKTKFDPPSRS